MPAEFPGMDSAQYKDEPAPTWEDTSVSYIQFLEAQNGKGIDPLSQEGQALQARYLIALQDNSHPLDVLRKISLNPFASPRDRIAASKALLEYGAVKAPSRVEVTGISGGPLKLDAKQLSSLSNEELEMLTNLLGKANSK